MEKGTKNLIICFVLAISILLAYTSCGERITSTERYHIENDSLQISQSIELTQNITIAEIGALRPFDNSKPMVIDGKKYFNVTIDFKKSLKGDLNIKSNESLSYTGSENSESNRNTEKTDYSNSIIGVIFVLALFLFLYIYLKNWKP